MTTTSPDPEPGMLRRLAGEVRSGRTGARDLVERALERIARHRDLTAVIAERADAARADADAVDAAVAHGDDPGPLAGLPVLAKDNDDVRGLRTTHGSRWFADAPPAERDGLAVGRLRAAGSIVVGKTNVPEFCIEGFTDNLVFGATRNPWNPQRSPGGSSGGSAAALAAGLAPIATGTDGGGSVRIPAAFCGLVGYKPTNGVIGRRTAPDWIDFSTDGFMATGVDDLRSLLGVVAGPVAGDPTALPGPLPASGMPTRLVVAERTDELGPLPADVAEAFHGAAERLAAVLGVGAASVEHREPGWFFPGWSPDEDWFVIASAEHASVFGRERIERDAATLHPSAREFLQDGLAVDADAYLAARRRRFAAVARLDEVLGDDAVLVTPTVAAAGWSLDGRLGDGPTGLLGAEVYSTAIQNVTGLPAVSLPAGALPDGMPFGLQVTAPRWHDLGLLALAARWEAAHPWPRTAPGYAEFG
ncbi:amidase family protein [Pseudolysinimonas kribbensis]|uniref:Amidase n=1 Tax=Pseudolysinimonas kribbensis TaxID=433641 RepID=A0ABQ6JYR0_9MICO|nr:amidase [Pseudolysinimonas kribbensis]GMA93463.1 amidase [Pseudolysinimonas kribbensis]